MGILPLIIAGGAASLLGTGMKHIERATDRNFNAKQAQIQRDWEQEMSSTAIQRQAADAQAAGINPAMLYANSSASGASTPSGAAAHSAGGADSSLGATINSAANIVRAFNNDNNMHNDMSQRNAIQFLNTAAKIISNFK